MKVEKCPPLKCAKYGSLNVSKDKSWVTCNDCRESVNIKNNKVKKHERNWHSPKGFIPKEKEDYEY